MNIFVLDKDPVLAAQYQCDKHVVKMVLESAQLLCSPFKPGVAPYGRTHYNHPCAIWTREANNNYTWLIQHAFALLGEFEYRFGKEHASKKVIEWCNVHEVELVFPKIEMTPFVQAMPAIYKDPDPVIAYRNYYIGAKRDIAKWNKGRKKPDWYNIVSP